MRKNLFPGSLLVLGALLLGPPLLIHDGATAVAAEKPAKPPKLNPKVLKPLQAALALTQKEDFAGAEAALQPAIAFADKTPFEQYQVDELSGFTSLKLKKYNEAAAAYQRALDSGLMDPAQVNDRLRLLAQLNLNTNPRDIAKSGAYARRYLDASGVRDPSMLGLVGNAAYFANNYGEAATFTQEATAGAKAAGQKPEEGWLQIMQNSNGKLKNVPGFLAATKELVRYYPRSEYWAALNSVLLGEAAGKDRQILQVFRFLDHTGSMKDADEFQEAASVANLLGYPGDALRFINKGYASGVLETSGDKAKSKALLDDAKRLSAIDQKSLAQFEKEAIAAKQGEADVKLGEAFLSYDQPAKSIEAIQRGLGKGGVKSLDEAHLALGRAHLRNNDGPSAAAAFGKVQAKEYASLAELWTIAAGQL
jgi:hypothetical protein